MINQKKWLESDLIISKYENEGCYFVDAGIQKSEGCADSMPYDLYIIELPNGDYIVGKGGNHRAVLSNQLDIKETF
ncbi:hypothetical protein [Brevibacillus laterosporus]|uniref:hypothetical protein n=1 Tax=Brevibacillus laterosporus TaxID=1465 RepID=UPI000E6C504D|nr:hypothetical protein [Brevibacillus laterosporus]AYB37562.1 hypothetical protein D5F52_04310 [Brevibacillus laterosporus]MBM7111358.1 hypothetical protein [Brevibacillus laterosporus]